jgi:hypothetical protein
MKKDGTKADTVYCEADRRKKITALNANNNAKIMQREEIARR